MRASRVVLIAATCTLTACGGAKIKSSADWIADGPYGVGVHTFTFVDSSRATPTNGTYGGASSRTLPTMVWYPATTGSVMTDAPLRQGRYPLVLHSHGFLDSDGGESYIGEHLASYGYIVAAPQYPLSSSSAPGGATIADTAEQPRDASFVLDQLIAQSGDASSTFYQTIDADKIVASGLSLGGLTTLLLGFHPELKDARIKAALAMAPPSCMFTAEYFANAAPLPLILLAGSDDAIVAPAANEERIFPLTKAPSELVMLAAGSHTGFAAQASLFDASKNYDQLGCSALGTINVDSFASLGSAAEGIAQDPSVCPAPCMPVPTTRSLAADRQHDLTKAIEQSFFDGILGRDPNGTTWVRTALATENSEATVTLK